MKTCSFAQREDRQHTCSPPGNHNGEDAGPDGDEGDGNEHGGGDGTHDIGPHS